MPFSATGLEELSRRLGAPELVVEALDASRSRLARREQGAFFTPLPLVEFLVEEALDAWFDNNEVRWSDRGHPELQILDPAAGDGRFLSVAGRSLRSRLLNRGLPAGVDAANLETEIREHCLIAIERDPKYAAAIRERIGAGVRVHCQEALLSGAVPNQSVEIVLGNPPYLRSINLGRADEELREALRNVYVATSHGEWDLYAAFLEQGLRWLRPGGELALVLPSRWWTAQWAGPLRKMLCDRGAVRALVDFGARQVFSGATVYTSVCFASRESSSELRVARHSESGWALDKIRVAELGAGQAWKLAVGPARGILQGLSERGPTLGALAKIAKGAGTNADSVFVIDDTETPIEDSLLRPLLRGRDVVAFGEVPAWPMIVVPYGDDGRLIPPDVLQSDYPQAYEYFCQHRSALEAREKGRFVGDRFYCFGRPQNMVFHGDQSPKIVVPDVTKQGRALIDEHAAMVLDSAYAIRLVPDAYLDLATLCAILNSRVIALWLSQHGIPLRGGYTRMKTAYLRSLPLPPASAALREIGNAAQSGCRGLQLDDFVRLAYGVDPEPWGVGGP